MAFKSVLCFQKTTTTMQNLSILSETFKRVSWVEDRRNIADKFQEGLEFRFFLKNDVRVFITLDRFQILFLLCESDTIFEVIESNKDIIQSSGFVQIWIPDRIDITGTQLMTFLDHFRNGSVKFPIDTSTESIVRISSFLQTNYPIFEYLKGSSTNEMSKLLQIVLNEDDPDLDYKPILQEICKLLEVPFSKFRSNLFYSKNPFRKRVFSRQEIQYVFYKHNRLPHPDNLHYGWSREECLYKPG